MGILRLNVIPTVYGFRIGRQASERIKKYEFITNANAETEVVQVCTQTYIYCTYTAGHLLSFWSSIRGDYYRTERTNNKTKKKNSFRIELKSSWKSKSTGEPCKRVSNIYTVHNTATVGLASSSGYTYACVDTRTFPARWTPTDSQQSDFYTLW